MPRSFQATHNLIAVSAGLKETGINTEQTLDTTMLCALNNVINLEPRREHNGNEAIGKEEPDTIYDLGAMAGTPMDFPIAQAQHFGFLLSYALGVSTPTTLGAGKKHTITPIDGDLDASRSLPSFTAAQRYGKTILKRRFASMFVDSFTAKFARDSWCSISAQIKGTGKKTDNLTEESITAYIDGTSLTLAANAVEGSDAAGRLANVQRIRVELKTGVWTEVSYSAVSGATPAVITIVAPSASHTQKTFKVLYIPTESGWMTFPSRITETPLRVSGITLKVGGAWSGSAFEGGRSLASEVKSLEWAFNNNLKTEFVMGSTGTYASSALREGRSQKIKLDREFREFILQQHIADNDTLGLYLKCEGALYDATYKYQLELIFPQVAVLGSPISVDGKRLAEAGDLQVLEHTTYGSVIAIVQNLQTGYAQ
ncbi:MAG: hypothetical protein WC374_04205 [Phycisphaerae bacterium]|jgi:hypothetical protein